MVGKIKSYSFYMHGDNLTSDIVIKFRDFTQVFGGFRHYSPEEVGKCRNYCGHFIYRIMQICKVDKLDDIVGKLVDCEFENGRIVGIGNEEDMYYVSRELP